MPTKIEAEYMHQGYVLPAGYTWDGVKIERDHNGIPEFMVPIATASGFFAWAVPFINGQALNWRDA